MNKSKPKNNLILLLIVAIALPIYYLFFTGPDRSSSDTKTKNLAKESKSHSPDLSNVQSTNKALETGFDEGTTRDNIDLQKVIEDAADFQSFIYPSLPGVSTNARGMGQPMDPVFVESYMNSGVDKIIVPFSHGGKVISLAFMRGVTNIEFKPGQLVDVSNKNWMQYPPISAIKAMDNFSREYPSIPYDRIPGLYHLGYPTPFYQFRNSQETQVRYLVNAVSGEVIEAPEPAALDKHREAQRAERMPPIRRTNDGLLEIVEERIEGIPLAEREQLEKEIAESNKAIEEGLLKIGPQFEVIYDRR